LAINNFTEGMFVRLLSETSLVSANFASWQYVSFYARSIYEFSLTYCRLVQTQGRNIRTYADYLTQRAQSYSSTKVDYVRKGEGRLKNLTIDKGLLREAESVQEQIRALLRCDVGSWSTLAEDSTDTCSFSTRMNPKMRLHSQLFVFWPWIFLHYFMSWTKELLVY
jgi:hypothetical protein